MRPQLTDDLGTIPPLSSDQLATIRDNVTAAARDADDAGLLPTMIVGSEVA